MNDAPPWNELFPPVPSPACTATFRVLRKRRQPLLLLPVDPALAVAGLRLFPAQTFPARVARFAAGLLVRANLRAGGEFIQLAFSREDPLTAFLSSPSGNTQAHAPRIAVLAGNAATPGRRFIVLVCDPDGNPLWVAKVGVTTFARDLIRRERSLLERLSPKRLPGIPTLRGSLETERVSAFSMDHVSGSSPRGPANLDLLRSWLQPASTEIGATPLWQHLREAASSDPLFAAVEARLATLKVRLTLWHGDFAPWNIKVTPAGDWTVLDWERGEPDGLPAWDWIHYVIQREILVRKASASAVSSAVDRLLNSAQFAQYAQAAAIAGSERDLLRAYLLYMTHIIKPSEGATTLRELTRQV